MRGVADQYATTGHACRGDLHSLGGGEHWSLSHDVSTCLILPQALKARRLRFPLTSPESVGQVDAPGHLVAQSQDVGEEFEECVIVVGALASRIRTLADMGYVMKPHTPATASRMGGRRAGWSPDYSPAVPVASVEG
jgi:hypothetical protein